MKYALILLVLCFLGCKQPTIKVDTKPLKMIDTSWYVILKFDKNKDSLFFEKNSTPATLSDTNLLQIDSTINAQVAEYNRKLYDNLDNPKDKSSIDFYDSNSIKHPEKYYKQILTVTDSKGKKETWIYCTCSEESKPSNKVKLSLMEGIDMVADGGSCFFQLEIDLTTGKVLKFLVNGVG